jgi:hypothetical protein
MPNEDRIRFSELIGRQVDQSFVLIPPFSPTTLVGGKPARVIRPMGE